MISIYKADSVDWSSLTASIIAVYIITTYITPSVSLMCLEAGYPAAKNSFDADDPQHPLAFMVVMGVNGSFLDIFQLHTDEINRLQ